MKHDFSKLLLSMNFLMLNSSGNIAEGFPCLGHSQFLACMNSGMCNEILITELKFSHSIRKVSVHHELSDEQ